MNTNVKNIRFQVGLNNCWLAFATLAFVVLWFGSANIAATRDGGYLTVAAGWERDRIGTFLSRRIDSETHGLKIRGSYLLTCCTEKKNGVARTPFCSILATVSSRC